ncbi:3991_t:CDS:1 [Funneliformis caledonium]|uniref:3991_t:CDS:1 n=1 Tax=Funneliformis caledonium TaxID=1117310 RepID=A0A9N9DSB8_9GLOM|nr:3991_t:CDS:1 [Funneliformis caledonium]
MAVTILGSRLHLDISPQSELATDLVSNYMRLMTYVSEDLQTVVTASPSEPPLAMVAAAIMNHEDIRISDILKHWIQRIRKGSILRGYRGETIAQFILLMVWDKHAAARSSPLSIKFAEPIIIYDYLRSLFVEKVFTDIWQNIKDTELAKGWVHFNHFAGVSYTLAKRNLLEFAKRGAAVYCKECQRGVDLVIPVLIDGNLDIESVTFILVQVKNHAIITAYRVDATSKLTPAYMKMEDAADCILPYLSLYMQIGAEGHHCNILSSHRQNKKNQISCALFGITKELYGCLNLRQDDETLEIEKSLKELRTASVDLMQLIEDEENKAIVHRMLPLYYPKDETASKRRKT